MLSIHRQLYRYNWKLCRFEHFSWNEMFRLNSNDKNDYDAKPSRLESGLATMIQNYLSQSVHVTDRQLKPIGVRTPFANRQLY